MGYTPKHAKPAALRNTAASETATDNRRHGLFAIGEPRRGRHAASVRPGESAARHDLRNGKAA